MKIFEKGSEIFKNPHPYGGQDFSKNQLFDFSQTDLFLNEVEMTKKISFVGKKSDSKWLSLSISIKPPFSERNNKCLENQRISLKKAAIISCVHCRIRIHFNKQYT